MGEPDESSEIQEYQDLNLIQQVGDKWKWTEWKSKMHISDLNILTWGFVFDMSLVRIMNVTNADCPMYVKHFGAWWQKVIPHNGSELEDWRERWSGKTIGQFPIVTITAIPPCATLQKTSITPSFTHSIHISLTVRRHHVKIKQLANSRAYGALGAIQGHLRPWIFLQLGICGAFCPWTPSTRWALIKSRGLQP